MFQPLRIDHHGWQLALLALALAGIADPKRARGGATLGLASAVSLAIGLEMLIYLALIGVATVLLWVADRDQSAAARRPMRSACRAGPRSASLLFASYANRAAGVRRAVAGVAVAMRWSAGALMLGLAMLSPSSRWTVRLGAGRRRGGADRGLPRAGLRRTA